VAVPADHGFRSSSGSLEMFAAIRRASSRLSSLAADHRPGSSSCNVGMQTYTGSSPA